MADLSMTPAWKSMAACLAISLPALTQASVSPSAAFLAYWKSGLAELSSYTITAERYGEMRQGQAVLVYVYEEIDADTRIKVESGRTPPAKRIPVLKLNNALKFSTGVYDYSVMSSVFAGLSGPGVTRRLEPRKVSFSSQEWCGNVFHQVLPRKSGLVSEIHSYFEAEGDAVATLPYPNGPLYYEDEMPILVRELDGEILALGDTLKIDMVPGLWERRKRHVPLAFVRASILKAGPETISVVGVKKPAIRWILSAPGITTTFHVEAAPPRKLLAWENSHGEKGELIASLRSSYWERNHNADAPLRGKLGLTYGVGGD